MVNQWCPKCQCYAGCINKIYMLNKKQKRTETICVLCHTTLSALTEEA